MLISGLKMCFYQWLMLIITLILITLIQILDFLEKVILEEKIN